MLCTEKYTAQRGIPLAKTASFKLTIFITAQAPRRPGLKRPAKAAFARRQRKKRQFTALKQPIFCRIQKNSALSSARAALHIKNRRNADKTELIRNNKFCAIVTIMIAHIFLKCNTKWKFLKNNFNNFSPCEELPLKINKNGICQMPIARRRHLTEQKKCAQHMLCANFFVTGCRT